jgi:hypothetical protein
VAAGQHLQELATQPQLIIEIGGSWAGFVQGHDPQDFGTNCVPDLRGFSSPPTTALASMRNLIGIVRANGA